MDQITIAIILAAGACAGIVVSMEVGRRVGRRQLARDPEGARAGTGTIEGAVFALLGLLIAFTFSGAASRFDARRQLIVEEGNVIGTAYLRLDLLPTSVQPRLRDLFRQYVEARLQTYRAVPDFEAVNAALAATSRLQDEIWREAAAGAHAEGARPSAPILLLPALNQMFDIATARVALTGLHPPNVIFGLLTFFALGCALLAGYAMAGATSRRWLHMLAFAAAVGLSIYVILDLEYPRLGLIRVDAFDQVLVDVRQKME